MTTNVTDSNRNSVNLASHNSKAIVADFHVAYAHLSLTLRSGDDMPISETAPVIHERWYLVVVGRNGDKRNGEPVRSDKIGGE